MGTDYSLFGEASTLGDPQARKPSGAPSPTLFRALVDGMLDPVVVIDGEGTVLYANRACAAAFGYAPQELLGRNVSLLMPEPHRSLHDEYLERFRRTGEQNVVGRTRELPVLRRDGRTVLFELSISQVELDGLIVFCGTFRDVERRKEAERAFVASERRFRAIFEGETQFVGLLTPEGEVLEINQAALRATGVHREDVVGRRFWEAPWWVNAPRASERIRGAVRRAAQGERVRFQVEMLCPDRASLFVDFSIQPILDDAGKVTLLIPEGHDITDLRRSQARELAVSRAFAEIGESASLLAHEIKNPITALNAALRTVAKKLGEDDRVLVEDLVASMHRLERLMRRTLALARPLDVQPRECDLRDIVQESLAVLETRLSERAIEVDFEAPADLPRAFLDVDLLEEVVMNLVSNAIEASRAGGRIRIELEAAGSEVVLRIDDQGEGIADQVRDTLFEPFVTTKKGGTGLGLALSRKAVEAQGGSIAVAESPLGGARFEVRMPLEAGAGKPLPDATVEFAS